MPDSYPEPALLSELPASDSSLSATSLPLQSLAQVAGTDVVAEHVANSLASAGWCVLEGLGFDPVHLTALQQEVVALHEAGALAPAAIGRGPDQKLAAEIRNDRTAWLDGQSAAQAALFKRFSEIQQFLNRSLYLGLTHFEAHFAAFEPGGFYRAHRDSFQGKASRLVSLVLYLNEHWQPEMGGELRIYDAEGAVAAEVMPVLGRTAVFLSEDVLHEVCPSRHLRYSIACWFRADVSDNLLLLR
tara:strand:- start:1376 stop:2107 length:732 start_codon:yes stop_codon:yes gene_type:complete